MDQQGGLQGWDGRSGSNLQPEAEHRPTAHPSLLKTQRLTTVCGDWDSCCGDCQVSCLFPHSVTQLSDPRHTGTLIPPRSLTKAKQTGEQPRAEVTGTRRWRAHHPSGAQRGKRWFSGCPSTVTWTQTSAAPGSMILRLSKQSPWQPCKILKVTF